MILDAKSLSMNAELSAIEHAKAIDTESEAFKANPRVVIETAFISGFTKGLEAGMNALDAIQKKTVNA